MPYLSSEEEEALIEPRPMPGFVETPFVKKLTRRALNYLKIGFPVHLRGISGTGKTTLALHLANKIGRPVVLVHGDEEYTTSDLIGGEHGYRYRRVVDNFISRVLKTEEDMHKSWIDNRLTIACRHGFTLIYDEFTRSRPEANNVLLSILQEGVLGLPTGREGNEFYLQVHPEFKAIFTSNPEEYAGVHKASDALRDRMITMDLEHFDNETEVEITRTKSGLDRQAAEKIVKIIWALRRTGQYEFAPTIRGAIMIAKSIKANSGKVAASNPQFREMCRDILASETSRLGSTKYKASIQKTVDGLIKKYC